MNDTDQTGIRGGLVEIADQVACALSKASVVGGRAFIRTAVLFPSGSTVVVVIHDEGGGRFSVSDLGQGLEEADMLGISAAFRTQATEIAARAGIAFDDHALVLTGAVADQLVGAVMAVANAASRALERAMFRTENRRSGAAVEKLVARLTHIFPRAEIAREVQIRGASTHPWDFDAKVTTKNGSAIFDIVTPHHTAIAFATTKFHDLARLEDAPARFAVVHRKASFGDLLAVIVQAAQVMEDDAPDSVFRRALAA
jgi:hypothetical protein